MPKVSVLVPLYNTDEVHLREMIESVLNQSFSDFEFLLLNDSPDNKRIQAIVESYQDQRIIYLDNPHNMGISASRNRLLDLAKGDYLAIFDHDDICFPDRLELQVDFLDNHPEVGVCGGWMIKMSRNAIEKKPEHNLEIKNALMKGCCVIHPASMLRKSILKDNNIQYEANYSPAEDYMLWIRLMKVTMFYNIPKPLIKYRDHAGNTSHRQAEKMRDKDTLIKSIAFQEFPYLIQRKKESWIYLFGFIPFIKVKCSSEKRSYRLFGFLPLWTYQL